MLQTRLMRLQQHLCPSKCSQPQADSPKLLSCTSNATDPLSLVDKAAVITGAGCGIGRATAKLFVEKGAKGVVCVDWDRKSLQETVKQIEEIGGNAIGIRGDVGDEKTIENAVDVCCKEFGGIHVMFANAGISGAKLQPGSFRPAKFFNFTDADWKPVWRVNVMGVFYCIKHATRRMLQNKSGGSIICTSSVAGTRALPNSTITYSASKAAVIAQVQYAASQLGGQNIRVNAICPGTVETGMTKPIFEYTRSRGFEPKLINYAATKRAGQPAELAAAVLFLASDAASYVNGQALDVDGGLSATHPIAVKS